MILPKNIFFQNMKIEDLDDSEVLSSKFLGLRTSAASLTSLTSSALAAALLASPASTALFHQKKILVLMVVSAL
jgi:hypothetical protein